MVPEQWIAWEHGISGVAFCVNGAICLAVGYVWKDLKCARECQKRQHELVNKRINTMEKCLAVMKEREEGYRGTLKDIKEDIGKLFGKMENVRVLVASIAKNGD